MRLSNFDLQRVLFSVNHLNSDHEPESLPRRTFDAVKFVTAADVIAYEGFGSDNHYEGPLWFEPIENVSNQMLEAMEEYVSDHPCFDGVAARRLQNAVRISDYMTLPQFRRTTIYNEFFRLLGTDRQIVAGLHVTPELTITCSLCRAGKDFSSRDCRMMDLLIPHLTTAFRHAKFIQRLKSEAEQFRLSVECAKIAVITLDRNLKISDKNAAAERLLLKYFKGDYAGLDDDLLRYVQYHRGVFAKNDYYLPPMPFEKSCRSEKLLVRFIYHLPSQNSFLLLEEKSKISGEINGKLTNRENEVLFWIAQGKTDGEIAKILSISPRTVQKHIENMFVKLGVETRTAAVAISKIDI